MRFLFLLGLVACTGKADTTQPVDTTDTDSVDTLDSGTTTEDAVLLIGVMIHLEGRDLDTKGKHDKYREEIMTYANLFDKHAAIPTWEARDPLSSCIEYDDPFLAQLASRGHGVGVHADVGAPIPPDYTQEDFAAELGVLYRALEWQGVAPQHVSGICSELDWVDAAAEAGFTFVTGIVDYCLKSLDEEHKRVADCESPVDCHDPYPVALEDRLHPWRASEDDWTVDSVDGPLLILPEAITSLPGLVEETTGPPVLTEADIAVYTAHLEDAIALADPERVNTFFLLWSIGAYQEPEAVEQWLQAIQPYVDAGQVRWASLPDMAAAHVAWEAKQ